ncbi:MAG: hypothetical protein IT330_17220 [Anaerolineae bacterium]|nr:hypothetical protein [Anaerolineae bacterium]
MNERLTIIPLRLAAQAAANGVAGVYVPRDFLLTQVSVFVSIAGGPSAATIDIQDDTVDVITGQDIAANGLKNVSDVNIAGGSVVEVDLNLTGGSTPTVTGEIALIGYWGA